LFGHEGKTPLFEKEKVMPDEDWIIIPDEMETTVTTTTTTTTHEPSNGMPSFEAITFVDKNFRKRD